MDILQKLSRQTVRIGSSDACEICLPGEGVAPVHAEIIHRGGGQLTFVPGAGGICTLEGRTLRPGEGIPFDFRSQFYVGSEAVPITHPDLCLMVMSPGFKKPTGDDITIGRDPERCHIVLSSPGVSGLHATLFVGDPPTVTDHKSTSGTWHKGARLTPEIAHPVSPQAILAIGPLPLPVALAKELGHALANQVRERHVGTTEAMPMRTEERRAHVSRLPSKPAAKHRTVMGTIKMAASRAYTIGRTPDNDIVLDYAQISGKHAKLTSTGGVLFLEDAGSELGTFVRGSRLKSGQKARVSDGERVLFGPMPALLRVTEESTDVIVEDHEGWAGRPLFDVAAANVTVRVADRDDSSKTKTLLDNVSFKALPGDLIALMGPSGSGKTTLLHALTGYTQPSEGEIRVNDAALSQVFETLRGSIGYVPQDDIIHPELTVREAVRYSARFRLPSDYSDEEIDRRVSATLSQLGIDAVAHLQIGRPEHKVLSGGQRKRVNIAMELVTDPVLLFLDEPTSGLAADDTTALVDLLTRLAHDSGKTIIATIHQPARDEYEKFNLTLVLGHGGVPLYFGPTVEAYAFFESWRGPLEARGIDTPRDMFAELAEREARMREKMPGASRHDVQVSVSDAYRREYEVSKIRREIEEVRAVSGPGKVAASLPRRSRPHRQLALLLSRYVKIKARDMVGTAILLLQAPLIGVLLSLVFGAQKPSVPYWCLGALNQLSKKTGKILEDSGDILSQLVPTPDHSGAIFFLVVAAVWFGTSNAAREVVSEKAIFRRERMVNLSPTNYALSKFLVLSGLCVIQCAVLLSIVFFSLGLAGGMTGFFISLGTLTLTAICSVALGLLLSTIVGSSEAAMALTPIALIPQVVLGGLMVPVTTNAFLRIPMFTMPSRWGFEGVIRAERLAVASADGWMIPLKGVQDSPPDFISSEAFQCALAQMQSRDLTGAWGFSGAAWLPSAVLCSMTVALLSAVIVLLSRRVS
jgi:ABC transport system ATP-binding/permease protein